MKCFNWGLLRVVQGIHRVKQGDFGSKLLGLQDSLPYSTTCGHVGAPHIEFTEYLVHRSFCIPQEWPSFGVVDIFFAYYTAYSPCRSTSLNR